jgi:hypothetical protein
MATPQLAKRIRRTKIFSSRASSSSSSDEEVTSQTTIQEIQSSIGLAYHFDYDIIENDSGRVTRFAHCQIDEPKPESESIPVDEAPVGEEGFEFRLFATPHALPVAAAGENGEDIPKSARPTPAPTRINIRSPTPDTPSDGRFLTSRPKSYYFTPATTPSSFALATLSGPQVLFNSTSPWPGARLPWRVTHLPASSTKASHPTALHPSKNAPNFSSRKPSKKRRILLRTRSKLLDAKAKEKEEHIREKKTRLNRERKVKRREKEKVEKENARLQGEEGQAESRNENE